MNAAQSENVRRPSGNASEGLLVQRAWNYVMNIIYHNPGKVVRVPSSRQLAEILGISRSTVNQAFEKLLDSLYGAEALDISTDIDVLEQMLAREGLGSMNLSADEQTHDK